MKAVRVLLHGLILAGITIGAIVAGYAAYRASGLRDQVAIQVLVAGVVCVGAFASASWIVHRVSGGRLSLTSLKELGITYLAAFLCTAAIFVPLHYFTQGYVTAPGNILGMWLFQVPFNLLSLMVANGRLLGPAGAGEVGEA
jgi:hypothetical protein